MVINGSNQLETRHHLANRPPLNSHPIKGYRNSAMVVKSKKQRVHKPSGMSRQVLNSHIMHMGPEFVMTHSEEDLLKRMHGK